MKPNPDNPTTWPTKGHFWLLHHEGPLVDWTNDVWGRVEYIIVEKPENEREGRLAEIRPVMGKLPTRIAETRAEYNKAKAEYYKAKAEYAKAKAEYAKAKAEYNMSRVEYYKTRAECKEELEALHKAECPDSKWNGRTIFGDRP